MGDLSERSRGKTDSRTMKQKARWESLDIDRVTLRQDD